LAGFALPVLDMRL